MPCLSGTLRNTGKPFTDILQDVRLNINIMEISTSIDISNIPQKVFAWIDDPDKAMHWQKGVKSEEIIMETPERIGTTFREEIEENGKSLVMHGKITDYIPDQLIAFQLESKIHIIHINYSVVGYDKNSIVTVSATIKWRFPMNVISLILGHQIKTKIISQTKSELKELKMLCEM